MKMPMVVALLPLLLWNVSAVEVAHDESCTQGDCSAEAMDVLSLLQPKLKTMTEVEQELLRAREEISQLEISNQRYIQVEQELLRARESISQLEISNQRRIQERNKLKADLAKCQSQDDPPRPPSSETMRSDGSPQEPSPDDAELLQGVNVLGSQQAGWTLKYNNQYCKNFWMLDILGASNVDAATCGASAGITSRCNADIVFLKGKLCYCAKQGDPCTSRITRYSQQGGPFAVYVRSNPTVRDPSKDGQKCGQFGTSNRVGRDLRGAAANTAQCAQECAENVACVAWSGIIGQWCIGCKVPLYDSHAGAEAYKKASPESCESFTTSSCPSPACAMKCTKA